MKNIKAFLIGFAVLPALSVFLGSFAWGLEHYPNVTFIFLILLLSVPFGFWAVDIARGNDPGEGL